ncbi:MAG: alpha/beta hydrolase [Ginsengibacter sp.]
MSPLQPYSRLGVWPDGASESNEIVALESVENCFMVRNTSSAELFVYKPKSNTSHAAIVICPGGGYLGLAFWIEGLDVAKVFNDMGITAVVLKYRLPNFHPYVPVSDARQALRIVRSHAKEWGIDPHKVGIAGFSAGGHLASFVGTHFEMNTLVYSGKLKDITSRPDFMALFYPVITMQQYTHLGSRHYLLGDNPSQEMKDFYSNEQHVTRKTPPTFIVVTEEDKTVDPQNSYQFNLALQKNNVPAELNIFKLGEHGFGASKHNLPVDNWPVLLQSWLKRLQIIE